MLYLTYVSYIVIAGIWKFYYVSSNNSKWEFEWTSTRRLVTNPVTRRRTCTGRPVTAWIVMRKGVTRKELTLTSWKTEIAKCRRARTTWTPCKRRTSEAIPRAAKFWRIVGRDRNMRFSWAIMRSMSRVMNTQSRAQDELTTREGTTTTSTWCADCHLHKTHCSISTAPLRLMRSLALWLKLPLPHDQAQRDIISLYEELEMRNGLFRENRAKDWQEIEVLRSMCCGETDRARQATCIKRGILRQWVNWWLKFGIYRTRWIPC